MQPSTAGITHVVEIPNLVLTGEVSASIPQPSEGASAAHKPADSKSFFLRQTSFSGIISECSGMQRVFGLIQKVAKTSCTTLILGESGTGKELVAKAVHKLSGRTGKLVPVNCGAIPEDILESELFGHEKGAFTGAVSSKVGRFQLADNGTIFLDEIGEMSPKLQVKLLRVLQERKVDPVGSTRSIDVNVRVIAATNKDLREEVKAGRFREDLFYRLQVFPIELPSLHKRGNDVVVLAKHFLERACKTLDKPTVRFSDSAIEQVLAYQWPGNVRELENLIERLAIMADGSVIEARDLPEYFNEGALTTPLSRQVSVTTTSSEMILPESGVDFNTLIEKLEVSLITQALTRTNWNKKAAARLLSLNRTTLVEKIKKRGLSRLGDTQLSENSPLENAPDAEDEADSESARDILTANV